MIDIHCHLLYDLDDGPRTLTESLTMCRLAISAGTRTIVATPHSPASTASRHYDPAMIRAQVAELNGLLHERNFDLTILAGTEVTFAAAIASQLATGQLLTLGPSRAVLLEIDAATIPDGFETVLFQLQLQGHQIVLAHPERLLDVQRDADRLLPLIERGVLIQITAAAITGHQGERLQAAAQNLLQRQMAHIVASDGHGLPPRRLPQLGEARAQVERLVGVEMATALFETTPRALIDGAPIQPARPLSPRRRGRGRFGGAA